MEQVGEDLPGDILVVKINRKDKDIKIIGEHHQLADAVSQLMDIAFSVLRKNSAIFVSKKLAAFYEKNQTNEVVVLGFKENLETEGFYDKQTGLLLMSLPEMTKGFTQFIAVPDFEEYSIVKLQPLFLTGKK